jgi:membrane-bound lytic murein transglycosylase D
MLKLIIILALLAGGCTPAVKKVAFQKDKRDIVIVKKGQFLFTEEEKAFIRFEAKKLGIPIPNREDIKRELRHFLGNKRGLEIALKRSSLYLPYILPVLRSYDLPEELAILPLIESKFNPFALSRSGAGGIWQLMPATARRYGLKVNRYVDERFDLIKSTRAAARYLKDLYKRFKNWELVLAAYNCGEGCVLRKTGGKDFWSRKHRLPEQTRRFVPRFFAALLIARDPQKYGLKVKPLSIRIRKEKVAKATTVGKILRETSLEESTFRDLNPHIRGSTVPAGTYVYLPSPVVERPPDIERVKIDVPDTVRKRPSVARKEFKRRRVIIGRKRMRADRPRTIRKDPIKSIGTLVKEEGDLAVIVLENGAVVYIKE